MGVMAKKLAVITALILILLFSGCVTENANVEKEKSEKTRLSEFPVTITDDFGHAVTINKKPERIVSLAPSNTEILFALGLGDKIVGVTDYCNYPEKAKEKPKVGGYSTVDIEKVLSLKPDLVVASFGNGEETIQTLRDYNITVIALNPKTLEDVMKDIEMLGKATGTEENATKLIAIMKDRIKSVEARAKMLKSKPKIAHILWHNPIYVSGNGTFVDELIKKAGGENVFSDIEGWKVVSVEDLYSKDPDIIIVNSGNGMSAEAENVIYNWIVSELEDLRAVKEGKVYVINSDIISRPSYRLVFALEEISEIISQNET